MGVSSFHMRDIIFKFLLLKASGRNILNQDILYTPMRRNRLSKYPMFLSLLGGHYTAYCQNVINGQWYEFDDQYVTEVHETVVQNAEAYVLFYR